MKILWVALILVALLVLYAVAVRSVTLGDGSVPVDLVEAEPAASPDDNALGNSALK